MFKRFSFTCNDKVCLLVLKEIPPSGSVVGLAGITGDGSASTLENLLESPRTIHREFLRREENEFLNNNCDSVFISKLF